MQTRDLTIRARSIAHRLTYNDGTPQAEAKHMLLELAHRLDSQDVRVFKKPLGLTLINGLGETRYLTINELILYRLFGVIPAKVN